MKDGFSKLLLKNGSIVPLSAAQDYPLWINALIFLAAGIVVWIGGARLAVFVDAIAGKTGMGQAFAGMLFLGGITSLPEVANVTTSSWIGSPELAINNLLGSAAINVLLLAVADAFIGRDALTSVTAQPSTLMMATMCILVLVAVAIAITTGDILLFGAGAWGIALTALSIGAFWWCAGYGERSSWRVADEPAVDGLEYENEARQAPLRTLVLKTIVAGSAIFFAGYSLSQTGDALAVQTGLGAGMVGFALIGFATSMPELSSIIAAMRLRRYELAFGQILGTNFVNLSLILLADAAFVGGPVINELGPFEVVSALLGAALIGIFLVGLLERRDATILRMGYDSLTAMVVFLGGIILLYTVK